MLSFISPLNISPSPDSRFAFIYKEFHNLQIYLTWSIVWAENEYFRLDFGALAVADCMSKLLYYW